MEFKLANDRDMDDISAIYEEEEDISIKRVYETKALRKIAVMIKAKTICDENVELEISDMENTPQKKSNSNQEDDTTDVKECSKPNTKIILHLNHQTKDKPRAYKNPRANSNLGEHEVFGRKENYTSFRVHFNCNTV
jgi:hypothetical protein